jgi:putative DNA methylase
MAIVAEGARERVYLDPFEEHERIALNMEAPRLPDLALPDAALGFRVQEYGVSRWRQLFSLRQLTLLKTCSDLVKSARDRIRSDALAAGMNDGDRLLEVDGAQGATAYADGLAIMLAFAVDKLAESSSALCTWSAAPKNELVVSTFRRHALSMTWDYAEANPLADSSGSLTKVTNAIEKVLLLLPARGSGMAWQCACQTLPTPVVPKVVSTDPPYFDNIGYADLSDFFYFWLREAVRSPKASLTATLLVPKEQELIASPHRHASVDAANTFFLDGMTLALQAIAREASHAAPVSIYYAFKQAESDEESGGVSSTGWELFLDAVLAAGFAVTATWPVRTERSGRSRDIGANALASSIVLACRHRGAGSSAVSRREFLRELERALPVALNDMTADPIASIAPVDLAQAAIGPGMAIFSKYKAVLEADGSPMSVHNALIHINKAIDDYFAHAEGDLDADTRFAIGWFQQYGFETGAFGEADVLARAKGTSVDGVRDAGVLHSAKGKVRLLRVKEYPKDWDPETDDRTPVWEACHQMCRALGESEGDAGKLLARMPDKQDAIRQLAYRLFTLCERKGWAEEARAYNDLVTSWPAIVEESGKAGLKGEQLSLI